MGTTPSHVSNGAATDDPLGSEVSPLPLRFFYPSFDLFSKEVETQRTGRLIKINVLAFKLIALHKELVFQFTAEGSLVFQSDFNLLRYNTTKIAFCSTFSQWFFSSRSERYSR